ncbi:MAG TPA: hypothetical protein VMO17_00200 [Terriglobia bacterium]|nr:hypothetical protein [Terriglobia bacterium]
MSNSELFAGSQGFFGSKFIRVADSLDPQSLEYLLATGRRSRGGPNKVSNKLRSKPTAYSEAFSVEQLLATGRRSRGGPNKISNKLRSTLSSYLFD